MFESTGQTNVHMVKFSYLKSALWNAAASAVDYAQDYPSTSGTVRLCHLSCPVFPSEFIMLGDWLMIGNISLSYIISNSVHYRYVTW